MARKNNFMSNMKFATLAQVATIGLSFFRILLIPKMISVEEFGNYQIYLLYLSYISIFILGFNDGVYLRYSKLTEKEIRDRNFKSTLVVFLSVLIIETIILILVGAFIWSGEKRNIMLSVIINIPIVGVYGLMIYYLQINEKFKKYAIYTIIEKLIFIVGVIIIFFINKIKFYDFILLDIISKLVVVIFLLITEYKNFKNKLFSFKKGKDEFLKNIKAGWKIMIGIYVTVLFSGVCRIFIENTVDIYTFSYYSLANSMTNIIIIFSAALSVVIFPFIKKKKSSEYSTYFIFLNNAISRISPLLLISYFIIYLIVIKFLLGYYNALNYLNILYIIVILQLKIQVVNNTYYKILRKETLMLKDNLVSLVILILGCIIFKNIKLILFWQVIVLLHRSISSQVSFINSMHIKNKFNNLRDIVTFIIFYICTKFEFIFGFCLFFLICASMIIKNLHIYKFYFKLLINRKKDEVI